MTIKPSNLFVTVALLLGFIVWGMWGASYQGVFGSIPLLVGGVVVFTAFFFSALRTFGDSEIDPNALRVLNYLSYPGQVIAALGLGFNALTHFKDTGSVYWMALLGACGVFVLVIGNIVQVAASISQAKLAVGNQVTNIGSRIAS